jgi:pyruvate dehydrogenase (quinone)
MVKLKMEVVETPDWQTDNTNPNFAKVADAIGLVGVRIEDPADIRSGLRKALEHFGPALIDVATDPNELSMPSHISADEVEGFGPAMMKLVLSRHIDEVVDTLEADIRNV